MKMMILSNPRMAAVITMVAIFVLGSVISYILMRVREGSRMKKRIDSVTNSALTARDDTIFKLDGEILDKKERIAHLEAKIARISVFIGKAVEEAGGK